MTEDEAHKELSEVARNLADELIDWRDAGGSTEALVARVIDLISTSFHLFSKVGVRDAQP